MLDELHLNLSLFILHSRFKVAAHVFSILYPMQVYVLAVGCIKCILEERLAL